MYEQLFENLLVYGHLNSGGGGKEGGMARRRKNKDEREKGTVKEALEGTVEAEKE